MRQVVGKQFISFRRLTSLTHASERVISEMRVTTGSKREGVIIVVKSCKKESCKGSCTNKQIVSTTTRGITHKQKRTRRGNNERERSEREIGERKAEKISKW